MNTKSNFANRLRGAVLHYAETSVVRGEDALKVILPILFVKWLYDVSNVESFEKSLPLSRKLELPGNSDWSSFSSMVDATNFADLVRKIGENLDKTNPTLSEALLFFQFEQRSIPQMVGFLKALPADSFVEHSEAVRRIMDELTEQAMSHSKRIGGEYSTPRAIVGLVLGLLGPKAGTLYDPVCGTGGFLVSASRDYGSTVSGRDLNPSMVELCLMRLYLSGINDARVEIGNALYDEPYEGRGFDFIVGNPPFSIRWEPHKADSSLYPYGKPPKNQADLAFVQRFIASLNDKGRAAFMIAAGAFYREGDERDIRAGIVKDDLIEAVFQLPNLTLSQTPIAPLVVVVDKAKAKQRQGKVLFVDLSDLDMSHPRKGEVELDPVLKLYQAYEEQAGVAYVASVDEIEANDFNLNVTRYVRPEATLFREGQVIQADLQQAKDELYEAQQKFEEALESLNSLS